MNHLKLVIEGITCDSKKVQPGYIFVAIEGEKKDGNDYIDEAIQKGAIMVISQQKLDYANNFPVIQVNDARKTLGKLNSLFYNLKKNCIKIIGVTGTNGKTTTTHIIEQIFRWNNKRIGLIGGLGVKINDFNIKSNLTTPNTEDLHEILYEMKNKKIDWAVMEVSSHGLKQNRLEGLKFDTAIVTNITFDHLNYHGSFEDYFLSKRKLFELLSGNRYAIINGDDPLAIKLVDGLKETYVITYGMKSKSTITASSISWEKTIKFNFCIQRSIITYSGKKIEEQEFPIELKLLGYHNIYNALSAITTALLYDIPISEIQESMKHFNILTRRLEMMNIKNIHILDDYAHNPDSFKIVFEAMQHIEYKRAIIIIAIRGNRGIEINKNNAEVIANYVPMLKVKKIIITSSIDYSCEKDFATKEEIDAFLNILQKKNINFSYYDKLLDALSYGIKRISSNDLILLLGSQGMDKGKDIIRNLLNK